ncbi:UNVERIFIED_CONTAM: hypothetical protein Sradi_0193800 [Sesamum radiatum]|uniref:Uncharacterized protein n=1 Tax=Sesamum radiatum TaxID=300843 RepID=A0AAW2VYR2_SESRA
MLMQSAAFGRALSLKCTGFRRRKIIAERNVRDLRKQLADSSSTEQELKSHQATMEAKVKELKDQLARSASEVAKMKEDAFHKGREEGFSTGEAAGATHKVVRSSSVLLTVEIKAANFVNDGFEKCKAQITKLQGFATGFDPSVLDPSLDNNLEPYPEVAEDDPLPNEFDALIADVENMAS